jgi:flagellum-specific peptidoglycan hydrolase FlgJ/phage-related protein
MTNTRRGELPRVARYASNIRPMVTYSTKNLLQAHMPVLTRTVASNALAVKESLAFTRKTATSSGRLSDILKSQPEFKQAKAFLTNMKEDLRNGTLHNQKRIDKMMAEEMGMGDMDVFNDTDFGDYENTSDNLNDPGTFVNNQNQQFQEQAHIETIQSLQRMMSVSEISQKEMTSSLLLGMQSTTNASASYTNDINMNIFARNTVMANKMHEDKMNVLNNIQNLNTGLLSFATNNMASYFEASNKFKDDAMFELRQIKEYLHESTEMTRGMYGGNNNNVRSSFNNIDSIIDSEGVFDLRGYMKSIKQNITSEAGGIGRNEIGMILNQASASPWSFIAEAVSRKILPKASAKALGELDKAVSGVFSTFILQMNDWKKRGASSDKGAGLKSFLGGIFGVDLSTGTKPNLSLYKNMDIDKEMTLKVNKSITEVIPAYLAKLVALQTGGNEMIYDHEQGIFVNRADKKKEYDNRLKYIHGENNMRNTESAMGENVDLLNISDKGQRNLIDSDMREFRRVIATSSIRYTGKETYLEMKRMGMNLSGGEQSYKIIRAAFNNLRPADKLKVSNEQVNSLSNKRRAMKLFNEELQRTGYSAAYNKYDVDYDKYGSDKNTGGSPQIAIVNPTANPNRRISVDREIRNGQVYGPQPSRSQQILSMAYAKSNNMKISTDNLTIKKLKGNQKYKELKLKSSSLADDLLSSSIGREPGSVDTTDISHDDVLGFMKANNARRDQNKKDKAQADKQRALNKFKGESSILGRLKMILSGESGMSLGASISSSIVKSFDKMSYKLFYGNEENPDGKQSLFTKLADNFAKLEGKVLGFFDENILEPMRNSLFGDKGIFNTESSEVGKTLKKYVPDIFKSAGIGAAASIILPGGPVIGTLLGGAIGFVKNSDKAKNYLFGEMGEDGKRKAGGLIPPSWQKAIGTAMPGMKKGAGIGALVAGLHGMPLAVGAFVGAGASFLKSNEHVQNFLFGKMGEDGETRLDNGLVPVKFQKTFKEFMPKDKKAMMAGGLIGSIVGGPILGGLMGSAVGFIASSDKAKEWIWGKEDENNANKKKGGLLGGVRDFVRDSIFEPVGKWAHRKKDGIVEWFKTSIKGPLDAGREPIRRAFGIMGDNLTKAWGTITTGLKDTMDKIFSDSVGMPMKEFVQTKVITPLGNVFNKVFTTIGKIFGSILASPIKAFNGIVSMINNNDDEKKSKEARQAEAANKVSLFDRLKNSIAEKSEKINAKMAARKEAKQRKKNSNSTTAFIGPLPATTEEQQPESVNKKRRNLVMKQASTVTASNGTPIIVANETQVTPQSNQKTPNKVMDRLKRWNTSRQTPQPTQDEQVAVTQVTPETQTPKPTNTVIERVKKWNSSRKTPTVTQVEQTSETDESPKKVRKLSASDPAKTTLITTIAKHTEKIYSEMKGQLDGVGYNLEYIRNILVDQFGSPSTLPGRIRKFFNHKRKGLLSNIASKILAPFKFISKAIISPFKLVYKIVKNPIKWINNFIKATKIFKFVKTVAGQVLKLIKLPFKLAKEAYNLMKSVGTVVVEGALVAGKTVRTALSLFHVTAKEFFKGLGKGVGDALKGIGQSILGLGGMIKDTLLGVGTVIRDTIPAIGGAILEFGKTVVSVAWDTAKMVGNTIKSILLSPFKLIGKVYNKIFSKNDNGKSKVMDVRILSGTIDNVKLIEKVERVIYVGPEVTASVKGLSRKMRRKISEATRNASNAVMENPVVSSVTKKVKKRKDSNRMATGGIVNGAQTALIGEAGPEAVLPIKMLDGMIANAMRKASGAMKLVGLHPTSKFTPAAINKDSDGDILPKFGSWDRFGTRITRFRDKIVPYSFRGKTLKKFLTDVIETKNVQRLGALQAKMHNINSPMDYLANISELLFTQIQAILSLRPMPGSGDDSKLPFIPPFIPLPMPSYGTEQASEAVKAAEVPVGQQAGQKVRTGQPIPATDGEASVANPAKAPTAPIKGGFNLFPRPTPELNRSPSKEKGGLSGNPIPIPNIGGQLAFNTGKNQLLKAIPEFGGFIKNTAINLKDKLPVMSPQMVTPEGVKVAPPKGNMSFSILDKFKLGGNSKLNPTQKAFNEAMNPTPPTVKPPKVPLGTRIKDMFIKTVAPDPTSEMAYTATKKQIPLTMGERLINGVKKVDKFGAKVVNGIKAPIKTIGEKLGTVKTGIVNGIKSGITNEAGKIGIKSVAKGVLYKAPVKVASGIFGLSGVGQLTKWVIANVKKFMSNPKVLKLLGNSKLVQAIAPKIAEKVAEVAVKAGSKELVEAAAKTAFPPAVIIFAIYDVGTGMAEAKNILRVPNEYEPTLHMRISAGLAKGISGLVFGLVDTNWLANMIFDAIGRDGNKESLKTAQGELQAKFQESVANGGTTSFKEFNQNENRTLMGKVIGGAKQLPGKIADGYNAVKEKVKQMPTNFVNNVSAIGSGIGKGYNAVKEKVKRMPTNFVNNVSAIGSGIGNVAKSAGSGIVKGAKWFGNGLKETFFGKTVNAQELPQSGANTPKLPGGKKDPVTEGLSTINGSLIKLNTSTTEGNGIKDKLMKAFNGVRDTVFKPMLDFGKKTYDWISGKLTKIGDATIEILKPIKTTASNIYTWFTGTLGSLTSKVADTTTSIKTTASNIHNWFTGTLGSLTSKVVDTTTSIKTTASNVYSWITTKLGKIGDTITTAVEPIKKGITDVYKSIVDKLHPVLQTVNTAVQGVLTFIKDPVGTAKQAVSGGIDKVKNFFGFGNRDVTEDFGRGSDVKYYNQTDKKWANKSFGRYAGRTDTMGEGGCAPTVAAMANSAVSGKTITPDDMRKRALGGGYKLDNNGTMPEFFGASGKDYGVDYNKLNSTKSVVSALMHKNPVVLMGQNKNGGDVPYGKKSPHYVLAKGIDNNGNVSVLDPQERNNNRKFKLSDLIKNTSVAMSARAGRGDSTKKTKTNKTTNKKLGRAFTGMNISDIVSSISSSASGIFDMTPADNMFSELSKAIGAEETAKPDTTNQPNSASSPTSGGTGLSNAPKSDKEFIQKLYPGAIDSYKATGVLPSIILAQGALESGWGKSSLSWKHHNTFGIKADSRWKGPKVNLPSGEYLKNGKREVQYSDFRVYSNDKDSTIDHGKFLVENSRYRKNGLFDTKNFINQANALQRAEYATDPQYANKLINMIKSYGFDESDRGKMPPMGRGISAEVDKVSKLVGRGSGLNYKQLSDSGDMQLGRGTDTKFNFGLGSRIMTKVKDSNIGRGIAKVKIAGEKLVGRAVTSESPNRYIDNASITIASNKLTKAKEDVGRAVDNNSDLTKMFGAMMGCFNEMVSTLQTIAANTAAPKMAQATVSPAATNVIVANNGNSSTQANNNNNGGNSLLNDSGNNSPKRFGSIDTILNGPNY